MSAAQVAVLVTKSAGLRGRLLVQLVRLLLQIWTDDDEGMRNSYRVLARSAGSADLVEDAVSQMYRAGFEFPRMARRADGLFVPVAEELEVPRYFREGVGVLDVYQRPAVQYRYWQSVQARQDELVQLLRDDPADVGRRLETFLPALEGTSEHAEAVTLIDQLRELDDLEQAAEKIDQHRDDVEQRRVTDEDAHGKATERAELLADDDLSMARRAGVQAGLRSVKATKYRRVIHPELTTSGTCGLCVAASTRVYSVDELMPIHDRCVCEQVEVRAGADYGQQFNEADLKELYDAAGTTKAADLSRVRYEVTDSGELGPIIVPKTRRKKRTTTQRRRSVPDREPPSILEERDALQEALDALERDVEPGGPLGVEVEYLRRRIRRLDLALAA